MISIVFDFGGVLADWNPRYLYRKIFSSEKEMEYFLSHVCDGDWNAELDAGKSFSRAVAERAALYPQYANPIRAYHKRWGEMISGEVAGTHALVRRLKQKGYKVYGLSNWSAETFPIAKKRFPIFALFDGIVLSGEEKLIKPDPQIFKRLLLRFDLCAEECLFIDDSQANVSAARRLGFDVVRFENAGQLERELQKRGIL